MLLKKGFSKIRQAVENLEARRLMSASLHNWSEPYASQSVAFQGDQVSVYATVGEVDKWLDPVPDQELPATITTQFALSADDIAGNEDDIPLGSTTTGHEPAYFGNQPWDWYSAQLVLTIPDSVAPGTYKVVSHTDEAGYDIATYSTLEVLAKGTSQGVSLGNDTHVFLWPGSNGTWSGAVPVNAKVGASFEFVSRSESALALNGKVYLSTDDVLDSSDVLQASDDFELPAGGGDINVHFLSGRLQGGVVGQSAKLIFVFEGVDAPLAGGPLVYVTPQSYALGEAEAVVPADEVPPGGMFLAPWSVIHSGTGSAPQKIETPWGTVIYAGGETTGEKTQEPSASSNTLSSSGVTLEAGTYSIFMKPGGVQPANIPFTGVLRLNNHSSEDVALNGKVYLSKDDVLDSSDVLQMSDDFTLAGGGVSDVSIFGTRITGATAGESYRLIYVLDGVDAPLDGGPLTYVSDSAEFGEAEAVPAGEVRPREGTFGPPSESAVPQPPSQDPILTPDGWEYLIGTPTDAGGIETAAVGTPVLKRNKVKFSVLLTNTSDSLIKGPTTFSVAAVDPETGEETGEVLTITRRLRLNSGDSKTINCSKRLSTEDAAVVTASGRLMINTEAPSDSDTGSSTDELFCQLSVLT